jgi:hypothetical protein
MRYELWKSVEDFSGLGVGREVTANLTESAARQPLRACSACAGDYEDPDRTARGPDTEEGEGETETNLLEEMPRRDSCED